MNKATNKFVSKLLKDYSRSMVGRLCKQIESLQNDLNVDSQEYKYLNHVKNLHKELIYESFRDIKSQISAYNSGMKINKFKIAPLNQRNVV